MSRICHFSSKRFNIVSQDRVCSLWNLLVFWGMLACTFAVNPSYGQIYFNNFQVGNGLSNNAVLCSAQDQDGFMWLGTRHGLNRFDGYNFRAYYANPTSEKGLGSNFIHSLCIGDNKEVWVGTDQGLYRFDPYHQTFALLAETNQKEIVQIQKDRRGDIWFIANNELFYYQVKKQQLSRQATPKGDRVSQFCIDRNDHIWYGAGAHLVSLFNRKRYALESVETWNNQIEKLYVDDENNIWIGTSRRGLYRWSPEAHHPTHLIASLQPNTPLFVRDIIEVDPQHLWIASEMGLIIYNRMSQQYSVQRHEKDNPWSLSDNALYTITKDHQQGLWVGTFFGGLNYYHQQHNFFEKIFPRQSVNSIRGHATREIVEDAYHNIWIGTEDEGLTCWSPDEDQFWNLDPASGLSHSNIHGLAIAGDSLFVGTFYKGMDVIDVRSKRVIKSYSYASTQGALGDDFIFSICRTKSGEVLLGTSKGLYAFTPGKDDFHAVPHAPQHIFYTSIFEDRSGNIWLTTWRNGIIRLDVASGRTIRYMHDPENRNSLNSNRANRIFQDAEGQIWIGTENGIALWQEKQDNFKRLTQSHGLPSNLIFGFEQDAAKNIWISTSRGLVKMNRSRNSIETFDTELGILDLQFNYNSAFKDSHGMLYFGSSKGLIRFNPDIWSALYRTNLLTPLYITGIQSHQQELPIGGAPGNLTRSVMYTDAIMLNHDESTISIDFAALNFVSAQSTFYQYRLLGLDSAWTFLRKNGKASFTKIPPGRYTFQVLACDANGVPISKQKQLHITIQPPLWASMPAFAFYGIFMLSLISGTIYFYDQRVREKNRQRLQSIKAHKEQELYKAKMDFFMRVTHEIKTPLTLIKAPLERIKGQENTEKTQKWLHTIQINTDRLISLTDQLLDFRKVETDELSLRPQRHQVSQLIDLCIQEFDPLKESRAIRLQTDMDNNLIADIDVEVIYKIVNNLLSNAFKYADKQVSITLKSVSDHFELSVRNDGIKLQEEDVGDIFKPFHRSSAHYQVSGSGLGLALAYSFTQLHQGQLFYDNTDTDLNTFVLRVPLHFTPSPISRDK